MIIEKMKGKFRINFNKASFSLLLIAIMLGSCNSVHGSGNVVTENRAVSNFDKVSLTGSFELFLTQSEQESLEIEGEDNILEVIETYVRGDILYIHVKENITTNPTAPVRLYLSMSEITSLDVSGASSIAAESIESNHLTLDVNGSGDLQIGSLSATSLDVDISGSGEVKLAGQSTEQLIVVNGSGSYLAADLESEAIDLEVNGAGEAIVWANQMLIVNISGSGSVDYYGNPTIKYDINGSGEVNSLGSR